jgi:ATP-binding cassette, subfamily B (MDR/TAP), member 1
MMNGTGDVGAIITVLLALNVGAFFFGNVGPQIQSIIAGVAAAQELFAVIERQSTIDPDSPGTELHFGVEGEIAFEHVSHIFPSRREIEVIKDFSMVFPPHKTTAIVGTSGCGKSTIVSLLMRFYDPSTGKIFLDGHDTANLNVHWLREQIGLVSQDATLFDGSVFQNVAYGLESTSFANESREVQMKLVVDACKLANAHDFIESLPNGYDQEVGIRGASLSGGQKQRVAIARAIVADPKILLLDEATSALDINSEKAVQLGLTAAATGRTTIIIAHRLSTIKKADKIIVMSAGKVVEEGTHNSLLAAEGPYHKFARLQELKSASPLHNPEITRATAIPQDLENPQTSRSHRVTQKGGLAVEGSTSHHSTSQWTMENYSLWQVVSFVSLMIFPRNIRSGS